MKELSDETLMELISKGDSKAMTVLFERHSDKTWSYISKRVPKIFAEDLYQDAFLKLLEKKDSWNGQPFIFWFYVVLRNMVTDFYRENKREEKYFKIFTELSAKEDTDTNMDELISTLPQDKAKLVKEFYADGFTYKELSLKYSTPEVSIRKRLSRAIQKLKGSTHER